MRVSLAAFLLLTTTAWAADPVGIIVQFNGKKVGDATADTKDKAFKPIFEKDVKEIAATKDVTPAQLALAWLLAQGESIAPIPGTKRRKNLEENVAALEIALTRDDLDLINEAAPKGAASGERYEDMSVVDR